MVLLDKRSEWIGVMNNLSQSQNFTSEAILKLLDMKASLLHNEAAVRFSVVM
jgi:hypothetical protein